MVDVGNAKPHVNQLVRPLVQWVIKLVSTNSKATFWRQEVALFFITRGEFDVRQDLCPLF